ncbi:MAG: VCBS repeat-containing protein [Myxococcota bacterium]|nr:VCBS repeat-containing protein [Myxococcota bacterium]
MSYKIKKISAIVLINLLTTTTIGCFETKQDTKIETLDEVQHELRNDSSVSFFGFNYQEMAPLRKGLLEIATVEAPEPTGFNQHFGWPVAENLNEDIFVMFHKKRSHHKGYANGSAGLPGVRFDHYSGEYLAHSSDSGRAWDIQFLTYAPIVEDSSGLVHVCRNSPRDPAAGLSFGHAIGAYSEPTSNPPDEGVVLLTEFAQRRWSAVTREWTPQRSSIARHNNFAPETPEALKSINLGPRIIEIPLPTCRSSCGNGTLLMAFGNRSPILEQSGAEAPATPESLIQPCTLVGGTPVNRSDKAFPPSTLHILTSLDAGRTWNEWRLDLDSTVRPQEPTALYVPGQGANPDRVVLLTRNHDCSYVNSELNRVWYGVISFDAAKLAEKILNPECIEGIDDWTIDAKGSAATTLDLTHGSSNITATFDQSVDATGEAIGNSFWALDTSDIIFNPQTERIEAVVTNRNGGGAGSEDSIGGMSLNLWSIEPSELLSSIGAEWQFEATLLQRDDRMMVEFADGFHPGASVVQDGYQRIYIYAGKPRIGERTGVFEVKRTLDTPLLARGFAGRNEFIYIPGDYNGDGHLDFVKAYADRTFNQLYVAAPLSEHLEAPHPGFVEVEGAAPTYVLFADNIVRTISADVDGDGRDDLLRFHDNPTFNRVFLTDNYTGESAHFPRSVGLGGESFHKADKSVLTLPGQFDSDGKAELVRMESGTNTNDIMRWDGNTYVRAFGIGYQLYNSNGGVRPVIANFTGDDRQELVRLYHLKHMHRMFRFTGEGPHLTIANITPLPPYYFTAGSSPVTTLLGDFAGDAHSDLLRVHEDPDYNLLFIADDTCPPEGGTPPCVNGFRLMDVPSFIFYKANGTLRTIVGNFAGDAKDDLFRVQADPGIPDDRAFYKLFVSDPTGGIGGGGLYESNVSAYVFMDENVQIDTISGQVYGDDHEEILRVHEHARYDGTFTWQSDRFERIGNEGLLPITGSIGQYCIRVDYDDGHCCAEVSINVDGDEQVPPECDLVTSCGDGGV